MSGTKFIKKTALSILMTVFAVCTGSAIALGVAPEKTYTASAESIQVEVGVSETDYSVATASVRLPDETYDSGALRYHVKMSVEKYNSIFNTDGSVKEANTKTGALILPAYLMGEATELTYSTPNVMDVNTTSAWDPVYKADGSVDYYEVKVCLTGIPQPNHSSKLVVRSYVKDASGNYVYTTQKDSASISDVALSVYNNANTSSEDKAVLKTTYLDKVITYNRNGETVTKTAMYGSTMAALEAENNEFIAWYDANGVEYDFNSTITSGNVTLYGVYEQNIVATAEAPKVDMSAYTAGGKYTVAGVTLDGTNVSSSADPAVLEIPASLGLGDKELTVTLEKADGSQIEVPVSATILTGLISTAEDWLALLPKTGDTGITNGQQHYYKLTNNLDLVGVDDGVTDLTDKTSKEYIAAYFTKKTDADGNFVDSNGNPITITKHTQETTLVAWWPNTGAFKGILDGAGYSVKCSSRWHAAGQLGVLNGATVKDIIFNNNYFYSKENTPAIAYTITNSVFENVTMKIFGAHSWGDGYITDPEGKNIGAICSGGCNGNTFKSLTIVANSIWISNENTDQALTFPSLFGNNYETSAQNIFENCIVYAGAVKEVGHNSSNVASSEDGLIINLTGGEESHDYSRWVEKSDRDVLVCSGCGHQGSLYFDKTVNAASQDVVILNGGTQSISLDGISSYAEVISISCNDVDLGKDIANLDVSGLTDYTKHGEATIQVVVKDTITGDNHTVSVPVILITAQLKTLSDFKTYLTYVVRESTAPSVAGDKIYGYYTLANNIEDTTTSYTMAPTNAWGDGFRATLDGRGYSLTVNTNSFGGVGGLFGTIYAGTIKNLTVNTTNYSGGRPILASTVFAGATIENVNINVLGGEGTTSTTYGMVLAHQSTSTTWKNVHIKADMNIGFIFGSNNHKSYGIDYGETNGSTFENCSFTAQSYKGIAKLRGKEINSEGSILWAVDGMTVNASTECVHNYEWITGTASDIYRCATCKSEAATFNKEVDANADEYVILQGATPTLDLAGVSAYDTVVSIKLGSYSLGTDPNSLTIPEALLTNYSSHGQQTIVVVVTDTINGAQHTINVPVIVATRQMGSISDFATYFKFTASTSGQPLANILGYYTLGADIDATMTSAYYSSVSWTWGDGFAAIFDGRGYAINNIDLGKLPYGLFGTAYKATIKNAEFNIVNYSGVGTLLGRQGYTTKTEDVIINVDGNGTTSTDVGLLYSLQYSGSNKMSNVTINSSCDLGYLFGSATNIGYGMSADNQFTDCVLNAPGYKALGKTVNAQTLITQASGLTINAHIHQYTSVTSSDMHYDYMKCQGSDSCTEQLAFKKSVTAATRYMYLEDATTSLTLDGVDAYTSVSSVSIDGTDYAVAVSLSNTELTLTFPEAYKADTQKHGVQTLSVVVVDEYDIEHTVSVPVIMVTKKIATREALINLSYAPIAWEVTEGSPSATYAVTQKTEIYGYYLLTASVSLTSSTTASLGNVAACANNTSNWVAPSGDVAQYGFRGTLDGQSKFYIQTAGAQFGLFGIIGEGAVFKNVTIRDAWNVGNTYSSVLARHIHGATFEGVTFTNINGSADTARSEAQKSVVANKGWLCWDSCSNLTFKNCTLTPGDYTIVSLLGEISDINSISVDATTLNSIAAASGKITSIGYDSTTVGAVDGGGYTVEELQAMIQAA